MFKAAIFDMDGVIVNTVPIHFEAWKKMFSEYGKTFTFEDYKEKVDGIPRINGVKNILTDLSEEEVRKAGDRKQNYFLKFLARKEIPVYDSTLRLIDELIQKGIKVAAVSSSKNCRHILTKIGLIKKVHVVIDGSEITKSKPDPQIFLMAAERLGATPDECVVFEDALLGVAGAKNGGMRCVGIDRYGDPARLQKADVIVNDLSEISFNKIQEMF